MVGNVSLIDRVVAGEIGADYFTRPRGLGDRVAKALGRVGITERRWLWLKSWVVKNPTCGCAARREKLNRWSLRGIFVLLCKSKPLVFLRRNGFEIFRRLPRLLR